MNEKMKNKILVIDDNPMIILAIKRGLEEEFDSYSVDGVQGGKECFELLKKGKTPDLILLDIMMPEMSGWDVYACLQENETWKKIPIIFLTAKTDDYSTGFGKLVSADYVKKPFSLDDLKERIDEVIKNHA